MAAKLNPNAVNDRKPTPIKSSNQTMGRFTNNSKNPVTIPTTKGYVGKTISKTYKGK